MNPNHFLAVAIAYLFGARDGWRADAAIGKTLVSSSMIDRVAADARPAAVTRCRSGSSGSCPGLLDGSVGFGGEESAGASFLRRDGTRLDDRQGRHPARPAGLGDPGRRPAARRRSTTASSPSATATPAYARVDAPATREEKAALGKLAPEAVTATELAGEPITATLTTAPGNDAPIGGLKVVHRVGLVRRPARPAPRTSTRSTPSRSAAPSTWPRCRPRPATSSPPPWRVSSVYTRRSRRPNEAETGPLPTVTRDGSLRSEAQSQGSDPLETLTRPPRRAACLGAPLVVAG